jgi:POT family proton-dependent oligopeptide transporter
MPSSPREDYASGVGATVTDLPPSYGAPRPPSDDRSFFGHPRGLSTLFFTEMWERFSYYGIRPLLVLYMSASLAAGGFGFTREAASSIVGIYAACVYLASLPGGWVADRLLGLRKAIGIGAALISAGHIAIGLSYFAGKPAFFLGLMLIVLGTGLLKPNISAIVGDLYPEGGARRDAGFSVFYMGINVGALIAPLITGYLGEKVSWHLGFGAAGVGMIIGAITYLLRAPATLGDIGTEPTRNPDPVVQARQERQMKLGLGVFVALIVLVVALAMAGVLPINPVALAKSMSYVMLGLAGIYFLYLFAFGGLDGQEKRRIAVIIVLFVFATIFWSAFEQAPTSLNLFARDYTNRVVFGWEMPTLWLQSANSLFVILLAPVFGMIWVALSKTRSGDLSSPAKFSLGLFFAALGFGVMIWASRIVIAGGGHVRVSPWWLVLSYLLQTFGELSLSPVGLSSMTKLAPRKFSGQMMGVWFAAAALGNLIAGLVGGHVNPENLREMPALFQQTTLFLLGSAVVLALMIVPIRRMMANVPHDGARAAH